MKLTLCRVPALSEGDMQTSERIERALHAALHDAAGRDCPPLLAAGIRHAVFPGGARVRPQLCLAVAQACGDDAPALSEAAAAAIELLHCASLVHDDLPCFDDAAERRGQPSVHAAFGEPIAVLAGDALIVAAFQTLGAAARGDCHRLVALIGAIGSGVGAPHGIVAGQAWESEPRAPLQRYHAAKTGALFVAAATAGAIAAGAAPEPWRVLGARLGEAYQVADDLMDVFGAPQAGKPQNQDCARARPNAVAHLGAAGAVARLKRLVQEAADSVPEGPGAERLRALVRAQAMRLAPVEISPAPALTAV
jgi:geranylgeranyl diphosphate synthase type II